MRWSLTGWSHGGNRFTPDHKIFSGNSVGVLEVRWQTECWQGPIWGTSTSFPLSFMKPLESGATGLCQRSEYFQSRLRETSFSHQGHFPTFSITWRNIFLFPEEKLLKASNTKCFLRWVKGFYRQFASVQWWTTLHIVWPLVAYNFPKKTLKGLFVSWSTRCFQPACAGITVIVLDMCCGLGKSCP